jgi:hypothetical protein
MTMHVVAHVVAYDGIILAYTFHPYLLRKLSLKNRLAMNAVALA